MITMKPNSLWWQHSKPPNWAAALAGSYQWTAEWVPSGVVAHAAICPPSSGSSRRRAVPQQHAFEEGPRCERLPASGPRWSALQGRRWRKGPPFGSIPESGNVIRIRFNGVHVKWDQSTTHIIDLPCSKRECILQTIQRTLKEKKKKCRYLCKFIPLIK